MKYAGLIVLLLWGCTKDSVRQEEKILMNSQWVVTAFTVEPGWMHPQDSVLITDLLLATEACARDDYYTFDANGIYTHHRGELRCNSTEPESTTSRWTLSRNDGKLWLSIAGTPYYEVEVQRLEEGRMNWYLDFLPLGDGVSRSAKMTLEKRRS